MNNHLLEARRGAKRYKIKRGQPVKAALMYSSRELYKPNSVFIQALDETNTIRRAAIYLG